MERELKARSARTGQERSAHRPCDCGAKNLSRRGRATLGAQRLGVGATSRVCARSVLARDTIVVQSKWGRGSGLEGRSLESHGRSANDADLRPRGWKSRSEKADNARGVEARRQRDLSGRHAVRPCLRHDKCAVRVGWARGLKARATKHTTTVLTKSTRIYGVRKRRR